jgi:hypothetical protein
VGHCPQNPYFIMPIEFPASPCSLLGSGSNHIRSGSIGATTIVAVLALRIHDEDNAAVKALVPNKSPLLSLLHCNAVISPKKASSWKHKCKSMNLNNNL